MGCPVETSNVMFDVYLYALTGLPGSSVRRLQMAWVPSLEQLIDS